MILERIQGPDDLRRLPVEQLGGLAEEVRQRIIEVVSRTGGHIASSLGAVELIIALHYCLDTPQDAIVFDVGHQSYAHKILTGRNGQFASLRQWQGLSGFPSREESPYDSFTSGHSSSAVSQALGLVCAQDSAKVEKKKRIVAVIGDGSLSGGLCFEGLNNAGHLKKDLLVVLNTNELSIAPNSGALSTYLNKIISLPIYNRFRNSFDSFLESRVPKGRRLKAIAAKFEEGLKGLFIPGILFEELGFRYFGPFDGHNLSVLIPTFKNILNIKGPRIIHVVTKKGKGYLPAEQDPVRFHGLGCFEKETGKAMASGMPSGRSFTQVFSDALVELARDDQRVVAVTAAMPEGTGLDGFRDAYPQRFYDVGIAEEHAVSFASGLAAGGLRPVVAVYSTFLQRAYDQLLEDACLQKLPVVFCLDRSGIVGEDGVTHQGIFDLAYLRTMPQMTVIAPADEREMKAALAYALKQNTPVSIRYPKGCVPEAPFGKAALERGKAEVLKEGKDYCIMAIGSMVGPSLSAEQILSAEGYRGMVINARFVKPLDTELLERIARSHSRIFTAEEGVLSGGFGSAVAECIGRPVERIGLPDEFIPHGPRGLLLEKYGLTKEAIAARIKKVLKNHG